MEIEEFAQLYCQYRAGSPPIPYGPTSSDEYWRQVSMWQTLHLDAYQAVLRFQDAIIKKLKTMDPRVLADRLARVSLERLAKMDTDLAVLD